MNTNHHRPAWSLALAAFSLTLITACGTTQSISDADNGKKSDSSSDTGTKLTPRQADGGDGPANQPRDDTPRKGAY